MSAVKKVCFGDFMLPVQDQDGCMFISSKYKEIVANFTVEENCCEPKPRPEDKREQK